MFQVGEVSSVAPSKVADSDHTSMEFERMEWVLVQRGRRLLVHRFGNTEQKDWSVAKVRRPEGGERDPENAARDRGDSLRGRPHWVA